MALPKTSELSAKSHFEPQSKRLMDKAREVFATTITQFVLKVPMCGGYLHLSVSMAANILRTWAKLKLRRFYPTWLLMVIAPGLRKTRL